MKDVPDPRSEPGYVESALAGVSRLSDSTTRILAPNASSMTLDGTNSYLVANRERGVCVVIDVGPNSYSHLRRLQNEAEMQELEISGLVLTHHHLDHSEAAASFADDHSVSVYASANSPLNWSFRGLDSRGRVEVGGVALEVIPTPGHSLDHVSFLTEDGCLLTGDHILGRGTSVVYHPEGSLGQYLESLRLVMGQHYLQLFPGHGPAMDAELGKQVVSYYLSHRIFRLEQIYSKLLEVEHLSLEQLVALIYGNEINGGLEAPAKATTMASLVYLEDLGYIRQSSVGNYVVSDGEVLNISIP